MTDVGILLVIGVAVLLVAGTLIFDAYQRRLERHRRRDVRFMQRVLDSAQRGQRRRPRVDRRIQRRRYGQGS